MSEYPKRLRPGNINSPEYWTTTWSSEKGLRRDDIDRFGQMAAMLKPGESVLDVAGGKGEFLQYLQKAGFLRIAHSDQSSYAVEYVRALGIDSYGASAYKLPFGPKAFDAVTLGECIEHLDDPHQAVAEAARVAKRAVVISTPYKTVLNGEPEHVWAFDYDSVFELLAPFGRVRMVSVAYDPAKQRTPTGWQLVVASIIKWDA